MESATGDIWEFPGLKVVPTNIGWRRDGRNVMGRGVALQASQRYPDLADWYGAECQKMGADSRLAVYKNELILFPVKPLLGSAPWQSWKQKADIALIHESTLQLHAGDWDRSVGLPLVGCGNGGLDPADVLTILHQVLDDRFTLILQL